MSKKWLWIFFWMSVVCHPLQAGAHGTEYRILDNAHTVTVACSFVGGDPMQYAKILIFGPDDQKLEFQNGRTDREGRFSFLPHMAGTWHVKVTDGMGHAINADIGVADTSPSKQTAESRIRSTDLDQNMANLPSLYKIIFSLSILFNFFLGFGILRQNKHKGGTRNT